MVTISDKPFVMVTEPSVFDGKLYCRTPTIACLSVNESLIRRNGYNRSDTVEDIFKGELLVNTFILCQVTCCLLKFQGMIQAS